MDCTAQALIDLAHDHCCTQGQEGEIALYLLCTWANGGTPPQPPPEEGVMLGAPDENEVFGDPGTGDVFGE